MVSTKGFITDVLTDAALNFISKHKARPFFCYVPFNAPHSPHQVADRYFAKYKAKGLDDEQASIYGMVENVDDNVARLLARLDQLGLAQNTIVVFATDNGPNGHRFNGEMKGIKGSVDEGGVRVPLFVRWPGKIRPQTRIRPNTAHIDLLPTLVDLCGLRFRPANPIDGRSLAGLLLGQTDTLPDRHAVHARGRDEHGRPCCRARGCSHGSVPVGTTKGAGPLVRYAWRSFAVDGSGR